MPEIIVNQAATPRRFWSAWKPLPRLDLLLIVLVMLLAFGARILPSPRTIDDAFITFRYSRNIVEGQGFVYNPGSRVLGTTTPLYTMLMAGISALLGKQDFPWYALVVNAIADAFTAALLFLLARRLTKSTIAGFLLGVLWAIAPRSVTFAVGGMETSLNILWMVGAVWFYLNDRPIWLGIFAGLGFLTRIDAVIWIYLIFQFQMAERFVNLRKTRHLLARLPWRTWIAAGFTVLPWLIFSWFYFGSLIPNSLSAKSVSYVLPPNSALVTLIQTYSIPFMESDSLGGNAAMIGSIVYLVLGIFGIRQAARYLPRLLPFFLYPWLYFLIFAIANPLIFRWYTVPPLPALFLSIFAGLWGIAIQPLQKRRRILAWAITGVAALLWVGTSANAWTLHPDHGPDRPAPRMAWHQIELYYQQVSTQLREQYGVTPTTRVASADIGTIGYFTHATIIDTIGLVTSDLSKYYPVSPQLIVEGQNYAIPPQLIKDTRPDFLVTMEAFVRLGLEKDNTFKVIYGEPFITIPTGFYGTDMRVYKRNTSN